MPGKNETEKYLGILEAYIIKQEKMKEKKVKSVSIERENYSKPNFIAVLLVRYSGPFLKGTREKLQQMNQVMKKLMMMHEALHYRDDRDSLWVKKEGGRGFVSF